MLTSRGAESWQRGLLLAAVPVTTLLVRPAAMEPIFLPKLLAGAALAIAVTALSGFAWFAYRRLSLPAGPVTWVALAFAVGAVITAAVAGFQATAVLGQYTRFGGLILYLSGIVFYLHLLALAEEALLWKLGFAIAASATILTGIGLLQGFGLSFLGLQSLTSPLIGTLGNPNFFAGFLGIAVVFLALAALRDSVPTVARIAAAAVLVVAIAVTAWSRSLQGLVAAGVGLATFALFCLHGRRERWARAAELGVVSAVVGGGALLALGVAGNGPLAMAVGSRAVQFRLWYWQAAAGMFADHPITGVGLDQYSAYFRRYRSLEAFTEAGLRNAVDAAHNVPLSMFANGGLILGVTYLAFVVLVLACGMYGFIRAEGSQRALLGAFSGAYLAYQVQALVSIDVPALAYLHWLLAAGVVAIGSPWPYRAWHGGRPRTRTGSKRRPIRRSRGAVIGQVSTVALAVIALWTVCVVPLRADSAAGRGEGYAAIGDPAAAQSEFQEAARLAPWQGVYQASLAESLLQRGEVEQALSAYDRALEAEPRDLPYTVTAARLAVAVEDPGQAQELFERALALEPNSAALATEVAAFYVEELEDEARARELVGRALQLSPGLDEAEELASELGGL